MKTLFVFFAFLFVASMTFAQTTNYKPAQRAANENPFGINTAKDSGTVLNVEGKDFPVFQTANGSQFLKLTSPRTNNVYAVWIGAETSDKYEGLTVRTSKTGKPFVLRISKTTGNPYAQRLEVETAAK